MKGPEEAANFLLIKKLLEISWWMRLAAKAPQKLMETKSELKAERILDGSCWAEQ